MFVYTVPMLIQPRSGETSNIMQIPQKANSREMEMMSLLSLERLCGIRSFKNTPKIPPRRKAARFMAMGLTMFAMLKAEAPAFEANASEMATL